MICEFGKKGSVKAGSSGRASNPGGFPLKPVSEPHPDDFPSGAPSSSQLDDGLLRPFHVRKRLDLIGAMMRELKDEAQGDILVWRDPSTHQMMYRKLNDDSIRIGRSSDNEIPLRVNSVSRRHARIDRVGGQFFVVDLNSSNGTRVNGAAVDTMVLGDGVLLELGNFPLIFSQQVIYPMGD